MTAVSFGGSPFLISKEEQEHFDYLIPNSYWVTHQNDPYAYVQLSFGKNEDECYRYHPGRSVVLENPSEKILLNFKAHEEFEPLFKFMKGEGNGGSVSLKNIEKKGDLSKDAMVMATKSFLGYYLPKPVERWSQISFLGNTFLRMETPEIAYYNKIVLAKTINNIKADDLKTVGGENLVNDFNDLKNKLPEEVINHRSSVSISSYPAEIQSLSRLDYWLDWRKWAAAGLTVGSMAWLIYANFWQKSQEN